MDTVKYSVLMSVYYKEKPEYLKDSILSMVKQTVSPDEIILVKDGPVNEELNSVISDFEEKNIIKVISLKENVGLGEALNIGLKKCNNELVARMDADDISVLNRCEKQLKLFTKDINLSLVGTAIAEFIGSPENVISYKEALPHHRDIKQQIKFRNPINHPSVMFKKSHVLEVGSYQHWLFNEDYYLWIRMIQNGCLFKNINEPLVKMRITNETYLRRGGWKYFITQKQLFDYMYKNDIINFLEYVYNNTLRFFIRILIPNRLRKLLYLKVIRKRVRLN